MRVDCYDQKKTKITEGRIYLVYNASLFQILFQINS